MPSERSLSAVARRVALHPATYAALPLLVIAVVVVVRASDFVPRFDYAIQELAVQEAVRAERLLGPYSRFGYNHPGPLLFYVNVPAYLVLGNSTGLSLILTRFVLDAVCIVLILVLVDRMGRRTVAWGAAAGIVWFELRVGLEWFRDPWNPYVVVLPIVLALVAGSALVDAPSGRRWRAVTLVIAGSFAVQSHIAALPLVAVALLIGAIGVVRSARAAEARRAALRDVGVAVGVGLVCWALPIWDQLAERGNLHSVLRFLTSGGDTPAVGTVVRPVVLGITLGAGHLGNIFGPQSIASVPRPGVVAWAVLVAVLVTAVVYALWSLRRARFGLVALALAVPVATVVQLVATLRIKGGVEPYLFAPGLAVGLLAWIVVGAAGAEAVERAVQPRRARIVLAAAVVVLGASALAVSGRAYDPPFDSFGSPRVADLQRGIDAVCATDRPVHLTSASAQWFYLVEVGAALDECAPSVRFDPTLETLVGAQRVDQEPAEHALVVRVESPGVAREPGWRRVARSSDATLDVRTDR